MSAMSCRSKKDLPGDPKLLRLQQKIRKQKEKQKAEMIRGHRRKEKIQQLQAMLRNKSTINNNTSTNHGLYRGEGRGMDGWMDGWMKEMGEWHGMGEGRERKIEDGVDEKIMREMGAENFNKYVMYYETTHLLMCILY